MDRDTILTYDRDAPAYAADWEEAQSAPDDLRDIVRRYFIPGPTVDIGCGSGRDTAWLVANGFDASGIDASEGLLEQARRRHPGVRFARDHLPELASLGNANYANVLCETVIMHLAADDIPQAVARLHKLLAPNGILYLTWRVAPASDIRDPAGRLYSAFEPSRVTVALAGTEILLDEQATSASSGKTIHRIVARRV